MRNISPTRLNKRIAFGTMQEYETPSGVTKEKFVPQFTVWCGRWQRSLSDTYTLIGTEQQDLLTVLIRHNAQVTDSLMAEIDGIQYNIVSYDPDESGRRTTYDTVTLKKITK